MATLTNLEIGSVVVGLIENVPSAISGLTGVLVNNNVYTAELITGNSISIDAIDESYQPGITSLTIGNVLSLMGAQGIGTESVKIGELAIKKGINVSSAEQWKELGYSQLKQGGESISFKQVWVSNA